MAKCQPGHICAAAQRVVLIIMVNLSSESSSPEIPLVLRGSETLIIVLRVYVLLKGNFVATCFSITKWRPFWGFVQCTNLFSLKLSSQLSYLSDSPDDQKLAAKAQVLGGCHPSCHPRPWQAIDQRTQLELSQSEHTRWQTVSQGGHMSRTLSKKLTKPRSPDPLKQWVSWVGQMTL